MPVYQPPLDHIRFVLQDVLKIETLLTLEPYKEFSADLFDQILEEGGKLCAEVLFPLNQSGDEEGCHFENGAVRTPQGFQQAYTLFKDGGWCGLSCDPAYGGMGLPGVINTAMKEMICSANMSFGMYPGLSYGAYEALHTFGTEELKNLYLPKIVDGSWSGTMCLTEPHCGTDLGLIKTKADVLSDGSFAITGTKIFISAGDHDLTENIVHLVLARLPGAPGGVKGISLFIVPKFLLQDNGSVSTENNAVSCGAIEHKMGIKGSSTCVMNFDAAKGWLVGEPHKGLRAMFAMMNDARLGVAMQGLGIAEVAYQNGLAYARERLQMRALDGIKAPDKPADPILVHPDVRRMILTGKAFTEGARALAYLVGMKQDIAHHHADPLLRQEADDFVALMTPILKAYQTDMGSEIANLAVQIYGGHGYILEQGEEHYVRDARIAQIYEGTNGIQALDLVGRKMSEGYGRLLRRFFHPVQQFLTLHSADETLQEFILPLAKAFGKLQQSSVFLAQRGLKNLNEAAAAATDYLRQFALVALGYMWCQMVITAQEKVQTAPPEQQEFYESKLHTARFFLYKMLPEADAKFKMILAGADPIMKGAL